MNAGVLKAVLLGAAGSLALVSHGVAFAAEPTADSVEAVRRELQALKDEQARNLAALEQTNARINALEARLGGAPIVAAGVVPAPVQSSAAAPTWAGGTQPVHAAAGLDGLDIAGDLRLRYEDNAGESGVRGRGRFALRARLRASYAVNDWLTVGGQLATGDPDDPNSVDITLSNFDDDLDFTLDQAYLKVHKGGLTAFAGKFANPFEKTDLVWDGDVSPQGASVSYKLPLGKDAAIKATALYFVIDEAVAGPDSNMAGGQILLNAKLGSGIELGLAGAYYDYSIRSVGGADSGDFRSNLIGPGGRYLSDFDLIDGIVLLGLPGFGQQWPIQFTGEYVKNLGAATDADTGYTAGLTIGRASKPHDLRFGYNYMMAETDAVFAAFSHDNLALGTNYVAHSFTADFVAWKDVILNATYNYYRPKTGLFARDWRSRLRLNVLVNF